jgi:hypothetical protein
MQPSVKGAFGRASGATTKEDEDKDESLKNTRKI